MSAPTAMSWWHESLIDYMLEHPDSTLSEMADHFGRTVAWLYMIRQSDAFQSRLRTRRAEHAAYINASQSTRLEALLEEVTERLAQRIAEDPGRISVGELRGVLDSLLRATGYIQANGHTNVQVNGDAQIALVDRALLEKARERLLASPIAGKLEVREAERSERGKAERSGNLQAERSLPVPVALQ